MFIESGHGSKRCVLEKKINGAKGLEPCRHVAAAVSPLLVLAMVTGDKLELRATGL